MLVLLCTYCYEICIDTKRLILLAIMYTTQIQLFLHIGKFGIFR